MSHLSPRLDLPYLEPSQAQKHVTHNEALRLLDAITQLAVESFGAESPPGIPVEGEVHALGVAPTGVWAGHPGELAFWSETAWQFITPGEGWRAWSKGADEFRIHDGSDWALVVPEHQNLESVGINTTADLTNRLAVTSPAVLFNNESGNIQVKLNKATAGDTASLLYQTNWSGRAEVGLTGDDNFHFKVSNDGATWFDAITLDNSNGHLSITGISGQIPIYDTGGSVFVGAGAGASDDLSDNRNVFLGQDSGAANTSGSRNNGLGHSSLEVNTTGTNNNAIGYNSLANNVTGAHNSAVGSSSLLSNTTGSHNNTSGSSALQSNTTGSHNNSIGSSSLQDNTTGSDCCAIGSSALQANTIGDHNNAIGSSALKVNTTGDRNSAIGYLSLLSNTTGSYNNAIGYSALRNNTTGVYNTAIGHNAGKGITTGARNTIIGANVVGLDPNLQNTVILADGAGTQRLSFDSTGVMDYKQAPDPATANPTFSHYITLKLDGVSYYIPAHNATF